MGKALFRIESLILISISLSVSMAAEASQDWVHLGAPPAGMVFVQVESRGAVAPLQITGTVNPARALANAKDLKLQSVPATKTSRGLWINELEQSIDGEVGSFYYSKEANKEKNFEVVQIYIQDKTGKAYQAQVEFAHHFLEIPVKQRFVLSQKEFEAISLELKLMGQVSQNEKLYFSGQPVLPNEKGQANLNIPLKSGNNGYSAELILQNGQRQIFNLNYEVAVTQFDYRQPVLSFKVREAEVGNFLVTGKTNPRAGLFLNEQLVPVNNEGEFEFLEKLQQTEKELLFKVKLEEGTEQTFNYRLVCSTCVSPDSESSLTKHLSLHTSTSSGMSISDNRFPGNVTEAKTDSSELGNFEISFQENLPNRWIKEFNFSRIRALNSSYENYEPGSNSGILMIRVENLVQLKAGLSYELLPNLLLGVSLGLLKCSVMGINFTSDLPQMTSVGFGFHMEYAYSLTKRWSLNPRIQFIPSKFSLLHKDTPERWSHFTLRLIGLRYSF